MNELRIFTADELKEITIKHEDWLASGWLAGKDGKRADLSSADLRNADLRHADLSDANLRNANLSFANLSSADLNSANLSSANLSSADLSDANLSSANLSFADLSSADLERADLRSANLSNANLQLVGQDIRGHLFWSFQNNDGVVVMRADCREFVGISSARLHWQLRHQGDAILHEDCLSLVDRCERMATARGWKLELEDK